MDKIEFKAEINGKKMKVELSFPPGAGGLWFISIDNYFHGRLYFNDGWKAWLNDKSFLTSDDIAALGERIDNYLAG